MTVRIIEKENEPTIAQARTYIARSVRSTVCNRSALHFLSALAVKGRYLEIDYGPLVFATALHECLGNIAIDGIERSPTRFQAAKSSIEEWGLDRIIRIGIGDIETPSLPFEDNSGYDLIYSLYTMHHWVDPVKAIANSLDLLNLGGRLYIYDFRRVDWLYHLPLETPFFASLRASYDNVEIRLILDQLGLHRYLIVNDLFCRHVLIET